MASVTATNPSTIVFPAPIDLIQPLLERTAQPTHSAR
jgi:hypothetical protein